MTERSHPASIKTLSTVKNTLTLEEELHIIAELLEELVNLIKGSTRNERIISEESSPINSEVMTIKEAAALLRISLPKMYEMAHSGKIHSLEIGRKIIVSRSSIMALLREGEKNV